MSSVEFRGFSFPSACGRLELFARDYGGEGPPLLLMHGLTRNSADFEPLAEHLAGSYRLVVPDQRGRGLSQDDPDPANYRPDVYAGDMFALLDTLGIARAGLVGTSMGGLMAMVMAAMQPERVAAIVLNDIGPELHPAGLARIAGYVGPAELARDWDEAAARCASINADAFPGFGAEDWHAFARRTCRERPDGMVEFAYDPAIAAGFEAEGGIAPPDLWPLWDALDAMPVLLVRGRAERPAGGMMWARRMQARHSGPFARTDVPGARAMRHCSTSQRPLAAISGFLPRRAPSSRMVDTPVKLD